jgi:hypothetical protein
VIYLAKELVPHVVDDVAPEVTAKPRSSRRFAAKQMQEHDPIATHLLNSALQEPRHVCSELPRVRICDRPCAIAWDPDMPAVPRRIGLVQELGRNL